MGRTGIGVKWLFISCVIQTSLGHLVNVARGKTCSQSTEFDIPGYPSSNAANGNTDGTFNRTNCIHTYYGSISSGPVDSSPWWQVNLGRNYPVFNITVWARADYVDRLYPLTITVDGQQCVSVKSSNSREQSLSCTSNMSGRVVRLTRGDRKVSANQALSLNLCEVQIWSTCQDGDYSNGTACVPCSSNCNNHQCNSDTGRCDSCPLGRYGDRCEFSCADRTSRCSQCVQDGGQSCRQGWYGDRCESSCSDHTSRCTQCVQDDGRCTVCSGNFAAPQCTDCVDGFYKTGTSCTKCTWKCDKDAPCNKTTGHCAECPPGKKGDRCDQDCDNNHYGPSRCSLPCGQCKESVQCDPVTGHCQQCERGWYLPLCKKPCTDNTYGINCSQSCGQCKGGQECNPQTGECTAGCGPGFKSSDVVCKTKCDNGMRGENCSIRCGHCQYVTSCHHVTGECGESGCIPGYSGALCLQFDNNKDNDSLVGPIVGAIVGSILGAGLLIAVAIWCRRKSNRSAGEATPVETASAPANNLSDSAITGPHPPPPSSSTPGVEGSVYEIVDNDNDKSKRLTRQPAQPPSSSIPGVEGSVYEIVDNDNDKNKGLTRQPAQPSSSSSANGKGSVYEIEGNDNDTNNGRTLPTAPPPSSSTAGDEGRLYENVVQVNTYDKLCPYANDERDRKLYTELDDLTTKT